MGNSSPPRWGPIRVAIALVVTWLGAGVVAGFRLHSSGGVFGDAVGVGASIAARLVDGLPWLGAVAVAAWAAGRWPVSRTDVLRPVTIHAWIGLGVVAAMQIVLAALRSTLVPPGLRPFDPWGALPAELTGRGPPALAVYAILVMAALAWRSGTGGGQEVPGAGRGVDPSS